MKNKNFRVPIILVVFYVMSGAAVAQDTLTLEMSIDIALKNSFTIHYAQEGVKAAAAQKNEAFTGFLPKFNTSYSYTRLNEAPFTKFQGLPAPYTAMNGLEIPVGTKDNYNWSIEARQPLFAGGSIVAGYQAGKLGEEAAREEEKAKYQDIIQEVRVAYFEILRAQKLAETARQSVEMLAAHRNVAENYFKVGMIPKNDLLHAEVELANGRQNLIRAENAVELTNARFNTVLKRKISAPVRIADNLHYQSFEKQLEECFDIAMQNRPELKAASLKTEQAGKMVRVAQSEYLPALSLVGNYSRFGDNASVSGSNYKDAENWYVMGVASWNFWEWGKTKYRVDSNRAKENQALDAARELNDQILLEVKRAYLILQEAEKQITVSQKIIDQAEENFRITEERFKESVATSTEVLDAQTLLTKAKAEYANALGDFNISSARLQRAMGIISR